MDVSRAGASDAEVETVYRERSRAFLLTVTALLRDPDAALDVVQDGFARALERRRTFRGEGSLEGWIWRIVLNLAHDRLRSRLREPVFALERAEPEPAAQAAELHERLLALPDRQRLAVFLRYYADLSYEQIAEALGVRAGTVAASLHAAHTALREGLSERAVG